MTKMTTLSIQVLVHLVSMIMIMMMITMIMIVALMVIIIQVLAHLVTVRYSPPSWRPLHWLSLVAAASGVALLLLSRGHYSIDVLLAYYVTTRLWHLYHAVACNKTMREEG